MQARRCNCQHKVDRLPLAHRGNPPPTSRGAPVRGTSAAGRQGQAVGHLPQQERGGGTPDCLRDVPGHEPQCAYGPSMACACGGGQDPPATALSQRRPGGAQTATGPLRSDTPSLAVFSQGGRGLTGEKTVDPPHGEGTGYPKLPQSPLCPLYSRARRGVADVKKDVAVISPTAFLGSAQAVSRQARNDRAGKVRDSSRRSFSAAGYPVLHSDWPSLLAGDEGLYDHDAGSVATPQPRTPRAGVIGSGFRIQHSARQTIDYSGDFPGVAVFSWGGMGGNFRTGACLLAGGPHQGLGWCAATG